MDSAGGSGARSRTTFLAIAIGDGDRGVTWNGGRGRESGPPAAARERQGSALSRPRSRLPRALHRSAQIAVIPKRRHDGSSKFVFGPMEPDDQRQASGQRGQSCPRRGSRLTNYEDSRPAAWVTSKPQGGRRRLTINRVIQARKAARLAKAISLRGPGDACCRGVRPQQRRPHQF